MKLLESILALPEGPSRTAALVGWVQDLYETDSEKPILVGGAAVELYTGGAYSTGDLDFVGTVPSHVASALSEAGFERRGRHWFHEAGEVFIEFPSSNLEPGEESVILGVEGERVVIVDPEALIADRLAAWQVWKSPEDGISAWLVSRGQTLDTNRLRRLAGDRGVPEAARALGAAIGKWRDSDPEREELIVWAESIPGE